MLTNREVITAKIESTYGVDASPAATDAVLIEAPVKASEGLRMNERPAVSANIATKQSVYGGRLETISFDVEIKGSGTAGTAPEVDALLRACGLDSTIVPATSVTYAPVSTGHESITIYYYQDGKFTRLLGARGTFTLAMETGGIAKYSFTFTGHATAEIDIPMVSPTYDSTVPRAMVSVPFTVGAFGAVINALNLDLGTTIATAPDISAADGYGEVAITKFTPVGSFDPENTLAATKNFYGELETGATQAIDTGVVGSVAGNRFQLQMPATFYTDISQGDRDGKRTLDVPFGCADVSGDDFFSLAFT